MEVEFTVSPENPGKEILAAELSEIGFEGFSENENLLSAYIPYKNFKNNKISSLRIFKSGKFKIAFQKKLIKHINWNSEWEKNFEPVIISGKCLVRAAFHEVPGKFDYEIIIQPKMSFGTGHHETTSLMLSQMLELGSGLKNKTVLDAGCGSGILSILAEKMGAPQVTAIDNDDWACINAKENVLLNHCVNIIVEKGIASISGHKKYNIILANINRNILLESMGSLTRSLNFSGLILMSGFYKNDLPGIKKEARKNYLKLIGKKEKNQWVMAVFKKITESE